MKRGALQNVTWRIAKNDKFVNFLFTEINDDIIMKIFVTKVTGEELL